MATIWRFGVSPSGGTAVESGRSVVNLTRGRVADALPAKAETLSLDSKGARRERAGGGEDSPFRLSVHHQCDGLVNRGQAGSTVLPWAERVSLLVALVALVATSGALLAQEPVAPTPPEIRVVHYNLRNWLDMERRVGGEVKDATPKPEVEKVALIKMLAAVRPDVLGVCEIGPEKDVIDLQTRLKGAGIDLPNHIVHTGADTVRHLAVLSRFPVVSHQSPANLTYQLGDQEMAFQRGVLDVTLQITPGYRLRLLGNHLKSRREVIEGDQQLMRRQEALLLRRHIDAVLTADPEVNLLVYGDFNDTKNEQSIRIVQGQFGEQNYLRDLWLEDADGYKFTYYWNVPDRYERIDFAFVSGGLWPEVDMKQSFIGKAADWLKASDHRPLVMALRPVDTVKRK